MTSVQSITGITILVAGLVVSLLPSTMLAVEPGTDQFMNRWALSDLPVATEEVRRTWMWGPAANTFVQSEPYEEGPGGQRLVQYFDKGRMEDNSYRSEAPWDVTMGLLVVEMLTGYVQIGDKMFAPGDGFQGINVAGDQGTFESSPTYASLRWLRFALNDRTGQVVNETVNAAGDVSSDPTIAARGTRMVHYDEVTGYNIADPFWEFMNTTGLVFVYGTPTGVPSDPNPLYVTGRPLTEPYWVTVPVGGVEKDVLLQCFERRCLTYTPDNPVGWQVESGNVGAHYYAWRYREYPGTIAISRDGNIWVMEGDGEYPRQLTESVQYDSMPRWSSDGSRLAFIRETPNSLLELWSVDRSGGNAAHLWDIGLTHEYARPSFDWSPDGQRIVVSRGSGIDIIDSSTGQSFHHIEDTGFVFGLDWSPGGQEILFKFEAYPGASDPARASGIYQLDSANGSLVQLTEYGGFDSPPRWSGDGSRFVISTVSGPDQERLLHIFDADGTNRQVVAGTEGAEGPVWQPSFNGFGDRIAYRSGSEIWVVQLAGFAEPNPWLVFDASGSSFPQHWVWSPDGGGPAVALGAGGLSLAGAFGTAGVHNLTTTYVQDLDWSQ